MKGRDLLILVAVVLLGGFAIADALRGDGGDAAPTPPPETATTGPGETTVAETTPDEGPRFRFDPVPGAGGGVVVAEAGSCAVREFDLPTGLELRTVIARSTCDLWVAPLTAKVAVGIGEPRGDAVPFRFVDLSRPGLDLGGSEAAFGVLLWSPDGQRAAWCDRRRIGIELEIGSGRRTLPECAAAYTPEGEVAFANGERLLVGDETALTASGTITAVSYGDDGSLAVVVEGRRIERYAEGGLTHALDLEERFRGRLPVLAPDNCTALFRSRDAMLPVDVGCSEVDERAFPGTTAAWSPDGRWVAVGGPTELTFHDVREGAGPVRWPIGVATLAWRRR